MPIKPGTSYYVKGEDVVFQLNGLNYTFEKFYLQVLEGHEGADDGLYINVPEEAPMNLINISAAAEVEDGVELNTEEIMGADTAKLTLRLTEGLYRAVKDRVLACTDPIQVFDVEHEGKSLKDFSHYQIVGWGCKTTTDV